MKNLFKEIRTRYYEFADWCDESNEVFVNKKNEVVGIVDMYGNHPIKYFFMNLLYKRTNEVDYGKEDYIHLKNSVIFSFMKIWISIRKLMKKIQSVI